MIITSIIKPADFYSSVNSLENKIHFTWLGQAGFAFKYKGIFLLIDPYLSDFLAKKYKGNPFLHNRLMQPPVLAKNISNLDLVFCTHRHSDHMDPETLPVLSANNPQCIFIVPRAELLEAENCGIPKAQLLGVNTNERHSLCSFLTLEVIHSAHEKIKTNTLGEHFFLGYLLRFNNICIYHSGDCLPFEGLSGLLSEKAVDIAILPVNGRDEYRNSRGIPGNFMFSEALELCESSNIKQMVACHFGMFDFNTITNSEIAITLKNSLPRNVSCLVPKLEEVYSIENASI